jgi:hypothetical protein
MPRPRGSTKVTAVRSVVDRSPRSSAGIVARSVVVLARPPALKTGPMSEALQGLGFGAKVVDARAFQPDADTVVLARGNARWHRRALDKLAACPAERRPLLVVWHSEPLPYASGAPFPQPRLHARELAKILLRDDRVTDPYSNARFLRALARAGLPDLLVVTSEDKREYLAEQGIEAAVVPAGASTRLLANEQERDLDVLFLGALVPRRKRLLRKLRRAGVSATSLGSWSDPALWGPQRTELLSRVKILLNIGRHPGQFAGHRFVLGMSAGCLVVSEPIYRPDPFVPGEHYVSAPPEELPGVIQRYVADEEARRQIAARGRAFVTEQLTLTGSLARILQLLEERVIRGS